MEAFSQLAFDMGSEAAEVAEELLPEDEELDADHTEILAAAGKALQQSVLVQPHARNKIVYHLFQTNFTHGWRAYEAGFHAHIYIDYPDGDKLTTEEY